jgi:uncharacterized membrane protein YbhN (UPF0104 family)
VTASNPSPRRGRLPPGLALAGRLLVVAGLLAWIASRVDFAAFGRTLAAADPRFLVAAGLVVVLAHSTAAFRWHRLLVAAGARWRFGRSYAVYAAGVFLGLFIPTGVGGDVYRLARVRGSGAGLLRGAATIVLERAIGLLALLVVGVGFVFAQPGTRPWAVPLGLGVLGGGLGLLMLGIPGGPERLARGLERLPGPGRRLAGWVRDAFPGEAMDRLRGALPGTVLLSLVNHGFLIAVNVLIALGLGLTTPWTSIAAAVPLVLLAAQLPITPGGLGVREAGYVYFLGRVGVAEEAALALALGWAALLYVVGLVAALGLVADRSAPPAVAAAPE